jgi:DNA end-binding protein Ku
MIRLNQGAVNASLTPTLQVRGVYIAPTDKVGQEAFAVIRDAIRDKGMVGLGRVVLTRREHVAMLEAFDKGLLATT